MTETEYRRQRDTEGHLRKDRHVPIDGNCIGVREILVVVEIHFRRAHWELGRLL